MTWRTWWNLWRDQAGLVNEPAYRSAAFAAYVRRRVDRSRYVEIQPGAWAAPRETRNAR